MEADSNHDTIVENFLLERYGMKLYKSADGFTQEEVYNYAGAKDCVANLTLRGESAALYGESLVVLFIYYQKERISLEKDKTTLNGESNVKAKELLGNIDNDLYTNLLKVGIPTRDIVEMLVGPPAEEHNLYTSDLLRKPKLFEIPFNSPLNVAEELGFIYKSLCLFINKGIELTPEERNEYLAYKIICDTKNLTAEEKKEIFDENERIVNQEVGYYWLLMKYKLGKLTEKNEADLKQLFLNRLGKRLSLADEQLRNMGLSLEKFIKKYPEKASLLLSKIFSFRETRYNLVGKHLLYMNFESFLHIYLRHVKELAVDHQFGERSKFQLEEKDIVSTMNIVLSDLNDEYQAYKDKCPSNRFFRKGKMAYYFNGDYYDIDILPDGHIGTFYKRNDKQE